MNSNNMTPAQIDAWIAPRYGQLKQKAMMTCYYDDDAFQDTYLSLRETGAQSRDLEAAFFRLYRALLSQNYRREMRYTHPDPLFFTFLHEDEEQAEGAAEVIAVDSARVDNACRALLNGEDYTLFSLRYKVGLSLREIAAYIGRSTSTIMQKLNSIMACLRAYLCPSTAAIAV